MPSVHGILNMKFIVLPIGFDVHISWNLSLITITPKHIMSSMSSNIIKNFSISCTIKFKINLVKYVTCYSVQYLYNKSCWFFSLKLDCKSSFPLLLQHDHVDMTLFQVGRSLVAPKSNFSTKYYNTILFQICLAQQTIFYKIQTKYCYISTNQHSNPTTTYQQITS